MKVLTLRRLMILAAVNAYHWRTGCSPTYREIGTAVGLASNNTVSYHLDVLREAGLLAAERLRPRTVRLGPRVAGSREGVIAEVVAVECLTCCRLLPVDHRCAPDRQEAA